MLERPADTLRQYIDADYTFEAYEEALTEVSKVLHCTTSLTSRYCVKTQ